ncbi:MAG: hypothetical protein Q4B15_02380 [Lachnospiraceae bacterium]|nr:hypothetical protein [Lachnospiraceae bacterium]
MDKAEYNSKLEEINNLAEAGDLSAAAAAASEIDWKHVKSVRTLCMIGEIYEANQRYEEGLQVLSYAYKRSATSKTVLYRLADLSIRKGDYENAERYCSELEAASPNDTSVYILRYRILKEQKAPIDDRIRLLEEFKEREYRERWAYELARLYHKKGEKEKCVEECDDIVLWFSEGKYVTKAMELKMKYQPLTESQQKKFNQRFKMEVEEVPEAPELEPEGEVQSVLAHPDPVPESVPKTSTVEAIDKMEAAAENRQDEEKSGTVIRKPVYRVDKRDRQEEREVQDQLADSIRQVFAGIRPQEAEDEAAAEDEAVLEMPIEESELTVRELEPETENSLISSVEKEQIVAPKEESVQTAESSDDFDTFMQDVNGGTEIDFEALLRETQSVFASEVASGNYEMTAALKEDTDEPEQAAEETDYSAGVETDESLGITREFNFREELRKAMSEGASLSQAVKSVSEQAEEVAGSGRSAEEQRDSEYMFGEIGDYNRDVPEELLAGENEQKSAESGLLEELSEVGDQETEASRSILKNIMEEPEQLTRVPLDPRPLTEVEKRTFSYFAPIPGMADQITSALADIHNNSGSKTSATGNVLIMGRMGSGKTRVADSLVLSVCRDLGIEAAKIAKVVAEDFNAKDPAKVVSKLAGGFLLIEGAGALNDQTAKKLSQAMDFRTDNLVVILEDEKKDLRVLLKKHPDLASKFSSTIMIPVFTNDELVAFGKTYCREMGYKMDEMGTLALYTMIGDNQFANEPVTVGKVKKMLDAAMERNGKRIRFGKNATSADGRIILREKDFNI